jgi:hypothetical protein
MALHFKKDEGSTLTLTIKHHQPSSFPLACKGSLPHTLGLDT